MKQHITIAEWEELPDGHKEKLRIWWFSHVSMAEETDFPCLLSIGQMIEFLGERLIRIDPPWGWTPEVNEWAVTMSNGMFWDGGNELCDALWGAVQEALEN